MNVRCFFQLILVTGKLIVEILFHDFSLAITNGGYAFLVRVDLMFFMSLSKEFHLWQTLNNLSIKHLIKLPYFL